MSPELDSTGTSPLTVVIGFGNILLKDEGIGVHILQRFARSRKGKPSGCVLIDGGTCGDTLLTLPDRVGKLIILDAVQGGGEPGSIYRFTPTEIESKDGAIASLHQLDLLQELRMMEVAGKSVDTIIILGVEPEEIAWGLELSAAVERAIPQVIRLLEMEVN